MSEDSASPAKRPRQPLLGPGADGERRPPTAVSDARGRLNAFLDLDVPECVQIVTKGYAVVTIMSPEEADKYVSMVWDDLEALGTGIKRDDPSTWKEGWPQTTHGALLV